MPKMKLLDSTIVYPFCKFAIKYCSIIFNGDILDQTIYFFENSKYHMLFRLYPLILKGTLLQPN